jgi:hypothetical protein
MDILSRILVSLKPFLKKLILQQINFGGNRSFEAFIYYVSENFSSNGFSLSLKDI